MKLVIVAQRLVIGPYPDRAHAKDQREKQHNPERKRSSRRLQYSPDHQSPGAPRQMLYHHYRQASERNAYPERVGQQIRAKELSRAYERAYGTQQKRTNA